MLPCSMVKCDKNMGLMSSLINEDSKHIGPLDFWAPDSWALDSQALGSNCTGPNCPGARLSGAEGSFVPYWGWSPHSIFQDRAKFCDYNSKYQKHHYVSECIWGPIVQRPNCPYFLGGQLCPGHLGPRTIGPRTVGLPDSWAPLSGAQLSGTQLFGAQSA